MNEQRMKRGALRDDVERALAEHWSAVLCRPVDERFADFFSLGGQSLTAMRLISRVEREMRVRLTLADLLAFPMLAEQATLVRERLRKRDGPP